jgi:subtilisin family serine protease
LTSHSDLTNADIETGYNYLDDNTDVTDTMGHGTRVMGLLCATANNGIGIAGIAPEATYVPLLVMRTNEGTAADLIQAIYDAVDKYNCKILNVSAGFETNLRVVKEAVDYVANKGAIMVCSAGNDGNNSPCYPASYDNTISVGAVDSNMELTSYSQRNSKVDVVAEGNFSYLLSYTGGYTSGKGTSFSSPSICGTAALIAQKYPDITLTDFRNIIKACTLDILDSGKDYAGYGYLKPLYAFEFMEDPNDVFVSPVYEKDSSTLNVKMYSKKGTASFKAIASVFENGSFSSFNIADAKANTYGIYTETLDNTIGTNKELRIFALENLNNLKNISDIRSVKQ